MIPDLIGFKIGEAIKEINKLGIKDIKTKIIAEPKDRELNINSEMRVVKLEKISEKSVFLLVCK